MNLNIHLVIWKHNNWFVQFFHEKLTITRKLPAAYLSVLPQKRVYILSIELGPNLFLIYLVYSRKYIMNVKIFLPYSKNLKNAKVPNTYLIFTLRCFVSTFTVLSQVQAENESIYQKYKKYLKWKILTSNSA